MDAAELRYYGHSAFLLTTPLGTRILIDPFGNPPVEEGLRWFLREFPLVEVDMVLISHPHFDHDAVERALGDPTVIRTSGEFKGEGFTIMAIPDKHAREYGRSFNHLNLIFVADVAEVRFCHLGDNRAELPVDVRSKLGVVDVLMVSVDESQHLLTYEEVDEIVRILDPKIVIPMHYFIPGLMDPDSTLKTADSWIERQGKVRRVAGEEAKFSKSMLPESREVWFFESEIPPQHGDDG